ncbi:MAG: AAA family ATPase [Kiritimatiellaeota bacterium]|nr:AAA family ATPase [Kiritimatiellota bacterium]
MPTAKQDTPRKLSFPILQRVKLSHFSLYTLKDTIEFKVDDGILCLAGANGLGKSTFLQVVGYGMTGVVPKPSQKFVTVDDYYRDIRAFTREYFDGRLRPEHLEIAEIELEMSVGNKRVTITRGFVESESLRSLKVVSAEGYEEYPDDSPEKRHATYEKLITDQVGLGSFREFVFVQSFVLTFDERRHLLFWDPKVLETCLLIFVGVDKDQREVAERLRREVEKSGSRVRNLVFDIKQVRDRLADIESALKGKKGGKDEAKTYAEFEDLDERTKKAAEDVTTIEDKIRDVKLAIADSAARSSALRNEYNTEFSNRLNAKKSSRQHPYVQQALLEGKCGVCGADGPPVTKAVKTKVTSNRCPLCNTELPIGKEDSKMMARLKELDAALAREKKILDSNSMHVSQLETERLKRIDERNCLEKELKEFVEKNRNVVTRGSKGASEFADLKKIYEEQTQSITRQRDEELKHGKKTTDEYRTVQKKLEQQYLNAREKFVPRFNSLAKLFLGVDLDIALESHQNVTLVLEVRRTKRRADYQLSESQRFFIDIALRMAFAQFASPAGAGAPLYIDTPEGSLDLAYEAQAGKMIAQFAQEGHKVFMTANINTSQLLSSIATNSRKCGFGIQRLYRWTEMSAVQEKQETKFDETLNALEKMAKTNAK